ncbi:hypothetical protein PGT21_005956 [Puccinia graminis f. sp. tritici]|uniref:Uncharacterized protein n=1 Tax=Puccinia graminis f. sp. tritici TaxID=56615 RepID=A0A5B0MM65_PUCGR|nr:hypothetical protein PGT21_005956 [Puccinia graminis f. sp. tritici]
MLEQAVELDPASEVIEAAPLTAKPAWWKRRRCAGRITHWWAGSCSGGGGLCRMDKSSSRGVGGGRLVTRFNGFKGIRPAAHRRRHKPGFSLGTVVPVGRYHRFGPPTKDLHVVLLSAW